MNPLKQRLKRLQHWVVGRFGMRLKDERTGEELGRYLVIPWRGRLHFIGQDQAHEKAFVPTFVTQARVTYWKQTLAFRRQPAPDFPHERDRHRPAEPPNA